MVQSTKYQAIQDHPMSARIQQLSSRRLKRSSFALETRVLHRKHQAKLPKQVIPVCFSLNDPPWKVNLEHITIYTTVPYITTKQEQNSIVLKSMTMSMLEERFPQEAWIRVYTDGSATNATTNGGAGVFIQYCSGEWQAEAIPTGQHCSNYKAEVEALIHAARMISKMVNCDAQVVFLTDALSVLQAVINNKLPELEKTLNDITCARIALQWIPSHCGVQGNEHADKMAKLGSRGEQHDHPVSLEEMRTIIKSLYQKPQQKDSYHELNRQEQVTIFRLRTGHNRLNKHLSRMKMVPSPKCQCGDADQDEMHVRQHCKTLQALREQTWPTPTSLWDKLHGTACTLKKTASFISEAGSKCRGDRKEEEDCVMR